MTTLQRFTINDFNNFSENMISEDTLDESVLKILDELTKQVTSPNYTRTPVFKKRSKSYGTKNKKRNSNMEISDEDWEAIRTFQASEAKEKSVGIDKINEDLRICFNKLSDKNEKEMTEEIISNFDKVIEYTEKTDEIKKICQMMFDIATSNRFYSRVYARLYKVLMNKHEIFRNIYEVYSESLLDVFDTINFVDSEKNYDDFCKNNIENEKRRSQCVFMINLVKEEVSDKNIIVSALDTIIEKFKDWSTNKEKKNHIEELTELMYIVVVNSNELFNEHEKWGEMINTIKDFSERELSDDFPGLSNKVLFKCMDIIDEIE